MVRPRPCRRPRAPRTRAMRLAATLSLGLLVAGCGADADGAERGDAPAAGSAGVLRLAVTTSTRDSGLLELLIPPFEQRDGVQVDVIAVGTGAALQQGRDGNVDVVLVHSRADEDAFLAAGHARRREDVMSNSFELLGPPDDPAAVAGLRPEDALRRIASRGARFVSRGDGSGTHVREEALWAARGPAAEWDGYVESGLGMGATLTMADQMQAYTLSDRGTFLRRSDDLELAALAAPSPSMHNAYGVLAVEPDKHPSIRGELADVFIDYLVSPVAQRIIAEYEVGGEPLFHPAHPIE